MIPSQPLSSPILREEWDKKRYPWKEITEPIIRFDLGGGQIVGYPFFSLVVTRYLQDKQTALFIFSAGTIAVEGPSALRFFEQMCEHRATNIRANVHDISGIFEVREPDKKQTELELE